MTMKEFYTKYNLNKYEFAEIAGVGTRSLVKFANGESVRESTKTRIEKAMRIAEEYNLVRPKFDYGYSIRNLDSDYKSKHLRKVHEYVDRFKKLIEREP